MKEKEKEKTLHILPELHKKLKTRSVKNESTIKRELNKILEKELKDDWEKKETSY